MTRTDITSRGRGTRPHRTRAACAAAVLLLALIASAGASLAEEPGETLGTDTEFTPVPRNGESHWNHVGGVGFGKTQVEPGSPTPRTVDFFGVRFRDAQTGFAAGAECSDSETPFDELGACERVPAIYRFSQAPGSPAEWTRDDLGAPEERPGYVAAVAFLNDGRALAVGGDGSHPRREPRTSVDDPAYVDPAGDGRAWLYEDGSWRELEVPPDMAGLSALDCSPREGFCVAGGLQQLWHWRDGTFDQTPVTPDSPSSTIDDPASFRFRVRSIAFAPGGPVQLDRPEVVAVTAGCCATPGPDAARLDGPRMLRYDQGKWYVRMLQNDIGLHVPTRRNEVRSLGGRQSLPDSAYSALLTRHGGIAHDFRLSIVAAMGAERPPADDPAAAAADPASRVYSVQVEAQGMKQSHTDELQYGLLMPFISSVRLVAADGDFGRPSSRPPRVGLTTLIGSGADTTEPDGLADWAVGEFTASGRAAAFTTLDSGDFAPNPTTCGGFISEQSLDCDPRNAGDLPDETRSRSTFSLPTYALNGIAYEPGGAFAWAVGDKGALVRLGGSAGGAGLPEPDPPELGTPVREPLSDRRPWDQFRPPTATGDVGAVPPLRSRPLEELPEATWIPAGAANPTTTVPNAAPTTIVMSRDGREGWALGRTEGATRKGFVLHHYDGSRWRECDPLARAPAVAADPACASLAPIKEANVSLTAAARVPFERDDNDDNDDEFEVVMLGSEYELPDGTKRGLVLRYKGGEWAIDEAAMEQLDTAIGETLTDIAFRTPTDGWIATASTIGVGLHRLRPGGWVDCASDPQECDDDQGLLPLTQRSTNASDGLRFAVAGDRVYMSGTRRTGGNTSVAGNGQSDFPMILRKDANGAWEQDYDPGCPDDPAGSGCGSPDPTAAGRVQAISAAELGDDSYVGWATGAFGTGLAQQTADRFDPAHGAGLTTRARLLRLDTAVGDTRAWQAPDASLEYLYRLRTAEIPSLVTTVSESGHERSVIAPPGSAVRPRHPMLVFDGALGSAADWKVMAAPFMLDRHASPEAFTASIRAIAPDGRGGLWLAAQQQGIIDVGVGVENDLERPTYYYRWGDEAPERVFREAPHPIRETISDIAAAPDGSLWVATGSAVVYRYDRLAGWERATVRGWEPGRFVTRNSEANAVAIGPDGTGVVVGKAGRIANVAPVSMALDAASGRKPCDPAAPSPPCGTGRDLIAAAIAPDGSALVGGEARALLWRRAGGSFQTIAPPPAAANARLTDIAMPQPARAWVTTNTGQVFRGELGAGGWTWTLENRDADGRLLTSTGSGRAWQLHAVAIDATGRGFAVGEKGILLERTGDGEQPWRVLHTGFRDELYSVALAPGGAARGAIIGGNAGLVLTWGGKQFEVARASDHWDPLVLGLGVMQEQVVGVAITSGTNPGEVEAWAAPQVYPVGQQARGAPPGTLLHHSSDPDQPLLNPDKGVEPLPDAPRPRHGEISLAAFGRSECHIPVEACPEMTGSLLFNEVVARRVADEIGARSERPGGVDFSIFTGDVGNTAGREDGSEAHLVAVNGAVNTPLDHNIVHRRWIEHIASRFDRADTPLFGALGGRDLSEAGGCVGVTTCAGTKQNARGAGVSLGWRKAFAGMPAPWGAGEPYSGRGLSFEPVEDPAAGGLGLHAGVDPAADEARTHYAVDVERNGSPVARLVVLDTSMRSLVGSEPNQSAPGRNGGQLTWLDRMICPEGEQSSTQTACTRRRDQPAVVVSTTPPYSYGPGATSDTLAEQAAFEALLLRHEASVVVSGRLGWNGRYWATAPGVHEPCVGSEYQEEPPSEGRVCGEGGDALPVDPNSAGAELSDALHDLGAPPPPAVDQSGAGLGELLPGVIASSAGGRFGPEGSNSGSASEGYWHGYSVVRVPASGDPAGVIVEQRPVFDWLAITAQDHVLRAGQRMTLRGVGRKPASLDQPLEYVAVDSPAITHRYDLVLADPARPYLPLEDANGDYVPLPGQVATIDRQTGFIRAGRGAGERTYAIGILSVGDTAASYPIAFEPRRSFTHRQQRLALPALPRAARAPAAQPVVRVESFPPPQQPPSASPTAPVSGINITPPQAPQFPALPASGTPPAPPPVTLQAPPPPPPPPPAPTPPPQQTAEPLAVGAKLQAVSIVPSVNPPAPPPVNPAPPAGGAARKEAKQRQAAVAKSEEGGDAAEKAAEAQPRTNAADSPNTATRHEQADRGRHAFTALPRSEAQTWRSGALYGGLTAVAALALALGWTTGRPLPRRRRTPDPAPAWARTRRGGGR